MSTLPEITDLFARLASNLKSLDPTAKNEDFVAGVSDHSISELNRSLNPDDEGSCVRVLDAALSLMCFKAPQVSSLYSNKDSAVRVLFFMGKFFVLSSYRLCCTGFRIEG